MIKKLALAGMIMGFATAPVAAMECRQMVEIHAFMLEARKVCPIKLGKDTSDLAYTCASKLSQGETDAAVATGKKVFAHYSSTNGSRTCKMVRDEFNPLIRN